MMVVQRLVVLNLISFEAVSELVACCSALRPLA